MKRRNISRRKFIGDAACAAIGSTTFMSTFLNLSMFNSLTASNAASTGDYKALVCIQLLGGNDSFNMLVPNDADGYNDYNNIRADLALQQADLIDLENGFGLHPAMSDVQNLYNNDNLAFLCNVGTLVEPLPNVDAYIDSMKAKPFSLRSHSDQRYQWQTSMPHDRNANGWGGRLADIMDDLNTSENVSMNISLGGRNVFQTGTNVMDYSTSRRGIEQVYETWGTNPAIRGFVDHLKNDAAHDLTTASYQNIFKKTYADQMGGAITGSKVLGSAVDNVPEFTTVFSETRLSEDLHMVAKIIAAQATMCMNRQTFFVNIGGWDMHSNLLTYHDLKLTDLNNALAEFSSALAEIGRQDDVTTFTISDFGRTLTSNNSGSDHAWGGHQIIMGGAVNGGQLYGAYPSLTLDVSNQGINIDSRGRFIPQVSTDEYFAELALWFGLDSSDLVTVLPNIGNFYNPLGGTPPLGFMDMS